MIARPAIVLLAAAVLAQGTVPAAARTTRTFVSGHGADSNPCSLSAPCRSFAFAFSQTSPGGEITVLDPAGYGAVTITNAISIVNDGVGEAGVTVTSATDAITVNAGANDVVNLRGLTLVGGGVGNNGVTFLAGAQLNIQNCTIRSFNLDGIQAMPTTSATVNISDTIVADNGNAGVFMGAGGSGTTVTHYLKRVQAIANAKNGFFLTGILSTGVLAATAADSLAAGNGTAGFAVFPTGNATPTRFTVVKSASVNNATGLLSSGTNAVMSITRIAVSGNSTNGFAAQNGGVIQSFHTNNIVDTAKVGSLTPIGQQ